jgi:predicted RNase H-like nuclease (RuvC/YqgF family)
VGCEDKVCQQDLQMCKKESTDQRKECAVNLSRIQELKTAVAEAQAKVDALTKENEELKAKSADTGAKVKSKATKGKHKKKRKGR